MHGQGRGHGHGQGGEDAKHVLRISAGYVLDDSSVKTTVLLVVTRLFSFEGDELYLNMEGRRASPELRAASPRIKVEVADPDHRPLEGLKLEDADPLTKTGRHRVSWGGKSDLSKLAGTPIQLKISIENAKLYSFQFE